MCWPFLSYLLVNYLRVSKRWNGCLLTFNFLCSSPQRVVCIFSCNEIFQEVLDLLAVVSFQQAIELFGGFVVPCFVFCCTSITPLVIGYLWLDCLSSHLCKYVNYYLLENSRSWILQCFIQDPFVTQKSSKSGIFAWFVNQYVGSPDPDNMKERLLAVSVL